MGWSQTCLVANGVGASEERVWFIPPRPRVWVWGHGGGHSQNASWVALRGAVFGKTARGCYEKRQVLIADPFGRGFPTNQVGRWGRGSPERLLLPWETRYLDLLHHVAELDQEFFRLLGSVRQPVEGLGELALQGEERVGLFPCPDLVLVPEEPTCAHWGWARSVVPVTRGVQPSAAPQRRPPAPAALGVGKRRVSHQLRAPKALDLGCADPVCLPGCLIPGAGQIPHDKLPLGDISPFGGLQTARGF